MKRNCVKALVSGKVQGVWYRRSTQQQAIKHGVTGHAINLLDGRVEVVMYGAPEQVKTLSAWLWQGPEQARVTAVELETLELDCDTETPPDSFTTG
ncbi:MAG: acylphosphatase [Halomonas sp.]